jgi:hypothetical protein
LPARHRGRRVFVQFQGRDPEECAFDRFEASHAINLFDLNCKYADVIPAAECRRTSAACRCVRRSRRRPDHEAIFGLPLRCWSARCWRSAQGTYPDKPIRLIVAFPPGGTTDIVGRLVAQKVAAMWGGKDHRGREQGRRVGHRSAPARASPQRPDGYTLTIGNSQTHGTNQTLFPEAPRTTS